MSSVTGIFSRDKKSLKPSLIKKMNNTLSHRGPDGSNVWIDDFIGFGHQMLCTTPESLNELLPVYDDKIDLAITADARIDNRYELSKLLNLEDNEDVPDSMFILRSYEKWGEKCSEKLLGDFAFAIWDGTQEKLFCARDHMGVKPFYYYLTDDLFAFSTEIKALFTITTIPKKLNEEQLAEHVGLVLENRDKTFYQHIYRLPAAHSLCIDFKIANFKKYWSLDPDYELKLDSDEEYTKEFQKILDEAVRCRLRTNKSPGAMLSGGLDTSIVVGYAGKILNEEGKVPLKTFSAIFDEIKECDEQNYIKKVISKVGTQPYYVHADELDPLNEIDSYLWHADSPRVYENTFMFWEIFREASKNGVNVLLDGIDGDSIVGHGKEIYRELFFRGEWIKLVKEMNAASETTGVKKPALYWELIFNLTPLFFKKMLWLLRYQRRSTWSSGWIIDRDFDSQHHIQEKAWKIYSEIFSPKTLRENQYLYLESGNIQLTLEENDWKSAKFGLEARHPFLDKRLVEFCLALPVEQKNHHGWGRIIQRRAMEGLVPPEVQWRTGKTFFDSNINRRLTECDREILESVLNNDLDLIGEFVDIKVLKEIYMKYLEGDADNLLVVWLTTVIILWLKKIS